MSTPSRYEPYWQLLLKNGLLIIQVPAKPEKIAGGIVQAMIKRKNLHRTRTGIVFNRLITKREVAKDSAGNIITDKVQITFKLFNLTTEDI